MSKSSVKLSQAASGVRCAAVSEYLRQFRHPCLAQLNSVLATNEFSLGSSDVLLESRFVKGARHNQFIRPILEGSIGLARRLGLQSVAEGVETEDEWHLLREIGCDVAQGYFIGRPMPANRVAEWLGLWRLRQAGLTGP